MNLKTTIFSHSSSRFWTIALLLAVAGCKGGEKPSVPNSIGGKSDKDSGPSVPKSDGGKPKSPAGTAKSDELFAGWEKPTLALFVSGRQHGYIEPCGCTGLANQKGGLSRRHTFQQQLVKKGWPLVALDLGNQVRRYGPQANIKFQVAVNGLKQMDYRAIALGPDDLRLSLDLLTSVTAKSGNTSSPFVCANAALYDPEFTPRFQVVEAGGKKVAVTAILGEAELQKINSEDIVRMPAAKGLEEVWPKLAEQKCDLHVLLAHTSLAESKQLAEKFPQFQVVVTAGGAEEPAFRPEQLNDGKTILVQVGAKGMYVGVIGFFAGGETQLRYQRVPLDSRFTDSRQMLDMLAAYQEQLKELGLEGLGVKPLPHPSGNQFVGSDACAECHTEAYKIWHKGIDGKGGPHAHALKTLMKPGERSEIPRHFDPECISCHVTGWNPQKHYPYQSGYLSLEKTPLLTDNGCENCHGPGSKHIAAETGELDLDDAAMKMQRAAMRLTLSAAEQKCMECHDLDNSPDFHVKGAFEKYWKPIAHKGLD